MISDERAGMQTADRQIDTESSPIPPRVPTHPIRQPPTRERAEGSLALALELWHHVMRVRWIQDCD